MGERDTRKRIEQPEKKTGNNVVIRNRWIRHAQKMSGEITNDQGTGISTSAISPQGEGASAELGKEVTAQQHGAKGYVSSSDRTTQTLEGVLQGYQAANPGRPVRKMRMREELTSDMAGEHLALYDKRFGEERNKILAAKGLAPEDYAKLSPDEQEEIAEAAEEPVIREWLDDPESELARLDPPQRAAARFAVLFNRRHQRFASKLYDGSEIDLFHVTHKTITEPFLVSGVLLRRADGQRITKLDQLQGSLETLGNWQSEVRTDQAGQAEVTVTVRGEEYLVDEAALKNLLSYEQPETTS